MGKMVRPKGGSVPRAAKPRTKQVSQEKETGQQNITSFFGKDSVAASQLWTTISSTKKGQKKQLSLSKRKATPENVESPTTEQQSHSSKRKLHQRNISGGAPPALPGDKDGELPATGTCTSSTNKLSVEVCAPSGEFKTSSSGKQCKEGTDEPMTSGSRSSTTYTSIFSSAWSECTGNAQQGLKPSLGRRNKKPLLSVQRTRSLRLHKTISAPNVSSPSEVCRNPEVVSSCNGSPGSSDQVRSEVDSEDDSIPPTPLPDDRHSLLKSRTSSLSFTKETPISLKATQRSATTIRRRAISDASTDKLASPLFETTAGDTASFLGNIYKDRVDVMEGEDASNTDNINLENRETSFSLSERSSSEKVSRFTLKSTRKAYKLSRKRNPRRVTSSPVKSKSDASGFSKRSGEVWDHSAQSVVVPRSTFKLCRSKSQSGKRPANTGTSPAHKRQQTTAMVKDKDKVSLKCNLFENIENSIRDERPVGMANNCVEEEQNNAHLLEYYGVDGKVSEMISRQDVSETDTSDNNSELNSDLVHENNTDIESSRKSPQFNNSKKTNDAVKGNEANSGFKGSESKLQETLAETTDTETFTEDLLSPCTIVQTPQSPNSNDRQAIMNVSLISPMKRTVNEDILNVSRDSLMDVDVGNLVLLEQNQNTVSDLLDGVEWSPVQNLADRQDKGSTLITPRSLFPPNEDLTKSSTTPDESTAACRRDYSRFLVLEVYRREVLAPGGVATHNRSSIEKVLRLFDEEKTVERFCYLREDWERTEVEPGDTVHVTGTFDQDSCVCVLDNQADHYILVHPDTLVSGTTVSMATRCLRRSILNERFRTEDQNEAMLMGTLLHDLFDVAMTTQEFSAESLEQQAKKLLQQHRYLNDLYSLGETELTALNKIQEQFPQLHSWASRFMVPSPHPDLGVMEFKTASSLHSDDQPSVCISQLKDIEENIWSPRFGLKGKVDATVEVKIDRRPRLKRHRAVSEGQVQTAVLPLELKTGRMFSKLGSVEHRAQVILYTLLMSDRRRESVEAGLLFYMKSAHMLGVPAFLHEKRALLMRRNEVARYLALDKSTGTRVLPGMLKDLNTCSRCPQAQNCVKFHKAVENGDRVTSGMGDLFDELTKHLSQSHIDYFADWFKLIYLEGKAAAEKNNQKEIWCLGGLEREKRGRCFGSMVLRSCDHPTPCAGDRTFLHAFERSVGHPSETALLDVPITCGDRVVVSEEHGGAVALASGFIKDVKEQQVMVLLDRDLVTDRCKVEDQHVGLPLYRLDRDEGYSAMTTSLSNVAKLLNDFDTDAKLRRLIVDLEPPAFSRRRPKDISDYFSQNLTASARASQETSSQSSTSLSSQAENILQELNLDQKNAVSKALSAQDYALILGMPGTGKTTTIACLVRVLVASGKTVLLTSYTHTAVDNILLKLKRAGLDFLRLGQTHKILPELHTFTLQEGTSDITTVSQLRQFYESKSVVATTCLGVNHALFNQRSFDFCIVDEASQITQPTCLGPLRHARVFILVGDHYQLPPLVQSLEAREGGMDVSLFKRLSEHHPQSVVSLEHQYRMNRDIMELTNVLIYEDRLKCGTEEVAGALLEIPRWDGLSRLIRQEAPGSWLLHALDPSRPVVFLDTDKLPAPETRSDHLVSNEKEAMLVQQLTYGFLGGGVPASCIGVISPYRHQLKVITQMLQSLRENIEINTVDKYQGRDKPCIVVSLVRSNAHANVGDLLKDWRRVNVAVTRAKRKLVLIGSVKTLRGSLLLQELFDLLESRGWIHVIPKGAQCTFKVLTDSSFAQQDI